MTIKLAAVAALVSLCAFPLAAQQPVPAVPAGVDSNQQPVSSQQPVPAGVDPNQQGLQILFDIGQASIRSDQRDLLDQASRLYRDGNPVVMIVTGSADTVGNASENLDLSIDRARRVANALVSRGIPIERLQILGRGNSELPVPTPAGVANEENRSVIINWR